MLATRRLMSDHKAFLKLLDRLEQAAAPGKRGLARFEAAFRLLLKPLELHGSLEEDFLFPPLDDAVSRGTPPPGRTLAQEHREIRGLLERLQRDLADKDEASLSRHTGRFCDRLRRHIYIEDNMAFPLAESLLGPERLKKIAREMGSYIRRRQAA